MTSWVAVADEPGVVLDSKSTGDMNANVSAINAILSAGNVPVLSAAGVCWINSTIVLAGNLIMGETPASGGLGVVGNISGVRFNSERCSVIDLRIEADPGNSSGHGIWADDGGGANRWLIHRVEVVGFPQDGMFIKQGNVAINHTLSARNNGRNGIRYEGTAAGNLNSAPVVGFYCDNNGSHGLYNNQNRWSNWHGLCTNNGGDGYRGDRNFVVAMAVRCRNNSGDEFYATTADGAGGRFNVCTVPFPNGAADVRFDFEGSNNARYPV